MVVHLFTWLPNRHHKKVFVVLLITTIIIMAGLQVLDAYLQTDAAPRGILSFEFVGSMTNAKAILASWDPQARVAAGLSLGLDYLFLIAYAGAIGMGCVLTGETHFRNSPKWIGIGHGFAWGQLGAALLDAVENYSLARVLLGAQTDLWPAVALWCAGPKFILVALGLAYMIIGVMVGLYHWGQRKK